jgi:hypothetical protein
MRQCSGMSPELAGRGESRMSLDGWRHDGLDALVVPRMITCQGAAVLVVRRGALGAGI